MNIKKTVVIWDGCGAEPIRFFVHRGDVTHLDGVYINSVAKNKAEERKQAELNKLAFDQKSGDMIVKMLSKFPRKAVIAGAAVITAGFVP